MAGFELTQLTEDTTPSSSDLGYSTKDPAGTPLDRKVTWLNVLKGAALGLLTADNDILTRLGGVASRLAIGANKFPARSSSGDLAAKDITDFALTLLDDANAAAARTTLGVSPTPAPTTYTPTWATSGTAPSLGNGTLVGRYAKIASDLLWVSIYFEAGSTTTFGTGTWTFAFPTSTVSGRKQTITAFAGDASAGTRFIGACNIAASSSTTGVAVTDATTTAASITNTAPFTWAQSDFLMIEGVLEVVAF